jgi:Flp pilus assembly pilin Flp
LTTIEYTLIAGLVAVALVGAGPPMLRALQAPFGEVAAALGRNAGESCGGTFCVEPAAGTASAGHERRRRSSLK